jgi:hypothetical protein
VTPSSAARRPASANDVAFVTMRHPVADSRRHECSAGSQYPTAGRPPSHAVTLTTLTPCSKLFRTSHRPQTSWVSPPDAVASPRRRHRPSPEVPRFVTLTRTQLAASRAAGQADWPSTVISKAGPPLCGVGPDCGLVPQAASAIPATILLLFSDGVSQDGAGPGGRRTGLPPVHMSEPRATLFSWRHLRASSSRCWGG